MGGALTLITPHGEALEALDAQRLLRAAGLDDLAVAAVADLAGFDEQARTLEAICREARGLTSDRLVERLDADASWTRREGDLTISCPSPTAGTEAYDADTLRAVLDGALEAGVVSVSARDAAVRDVTPPPRISWQTLSELCDALNGDLDRPDHDDVTTLAHSILRSRPTPTYSVQHAGVQRLLKRGGALAEAVQRCRVAVTPPRRVARVKRERAA